MAVVNGQAQCLLDVIAPQSDLVKTLNDNDRTGMQLYFAEIDNDDLEDYEVAGSKVYSLVEFNDEIYPNLSTMGDPEMLAISAVLAHAARLRPGPSAGGVGPGHAAADRRQGHRARGLRRDQAVRGVEAGAWPGRAHGPAGVTRPFAPC